MLEWIAGTWLHHVMTDYAWAFPMAEAAHFYETHTAMPASASMGEAVKNSMFPGAAMIYLIGHDAIYDLRRSQEADLGESFDLRAFHDAFLAHGSIPVALVADKMRALSVATY